MLTLTCPDSVQHYFDSLMARGHVYAAIRGSEVLGYRLTFARACRAYPGSEIIKLYNQQEVSKSC